MQNRLETFDSAALLNDLCARASFAPGEELRRKGDHYRNMYLITEGCVEVRREHGPGTDAIPGGPGSPVGEIGFLNGCRATATVTAKSKTEVVVLDDATLWEIEQKEPDLAVVLLRALARTAEHRVSVNASVDGDEDDRADSDIEVLLCRNDAMLQEALSLRYRVYCEELGRSSPYADHDKKVIRDNLDAFGHTFLATREKETVGTVRCNFSAEGPLGTLEELYGMVDSPAHPEHTMICTKLIVKKSKRGGRTYMTLVKAMARYASKEGIHACFIDSIPALVPMYKRLGFVPAGEDFFHYENGPSVPLVTAVTAYAERYDPGGRAG